MTNNEIRIKILQETYNAASEAGSLTRFCMSPEYLLETLQLERKELFLISAI